MASLGSQQPSRHAQYGKHWGEGAARCFSIDADILDEDHAVRLMPVPDSFICPISAAIMVDPVATVDGCVYERQYIERWFRERRQQGHRISSPITGLELPSATLMPLVALQRAIEAYLAHRPELKAEQMAGRSFEEAAQILQTDLFEKQAVHATTQDKLKRLKQANKVLVQSLQAADERIRLLESERRALSPAPPPVAACGECPTMARLPVQAPTAAAPEQLLALSGAAACRAGGSGKKKKEAERHQGRLTTGQNGFCPGDVRSTVLCVLRVLPLLLLLLLAVASAWWFCPGCLRAEEASLLAAPVAPPAAFPPALSAAAWEPPARRREHPEDAVLAPSAPNPAFALHLEQLRTGNSNDKQRAAFMLRIFAAEHAENQVAIAQAGAIIPLVGLLRETAPALREEAARALWNLARNNKEINANNQAAIGRAGAIPPLARLLEDDAPRVRVVAAAVLNDLATDNVENQVAIARAGAIAPLIKLLKQDEAPALVMAASLLKSLATSHVDGTVAAALVGAVPPLVALLRADTLLAQEQAASTLGALAAYSSDLQAALVHAGAIVPLVERLKGDMMQGTAALALRNLAAGQPENQIAIARAGAILPLVKLLEDGMPGVREEAAHALWNLAAENLDNQVAIVQAGAAIPLVALLKGKAQEQATITLLNLTS